MEPNHIDTFVRGTDNALSHKAWGGSFWSDWESLGGKLTSALTVSSKRPNQLDVFVKGTHNELLYKSKEIETWADCESLAGVFSSLIISI